jgi:hypothetical protein
MMNENAVNRVATVKATVLRMILLKKNLMVKRHLYASRLKYIDLILDVEVYSGPLAMSNCACWLGKSLSRPHWQNASTNREF